MDPTSARQPLGKSALLHALVRERGGFYWEATRGEPAVHLARLGEALGSHLGTGRLALESWEDGVSRLLSLGAAGTTPLALDEFGFLLEAEPRLDSVIPAAMGPGSA